MLKASMKYMEVTELIQALISLRRKKVLTHARKKVEGGG